MKNPKIPRTLRCTTYYPLYNLSLSFTWWKPFLKKNLPLKLKINFTRLFIQKTWNLYPYFKNFKLSYLLNYFLFISNFKIRYILKLKLIFLKSDQIGFNSFLLDTRPKVLTCRFIQNLNKNQLL